MKFFIVITVISCCIANISITAVPIGLSEDGNLAMEGSVVDEVLADNLGKTLNRVRRFSCDLFSFESVWVTPRDAVCASKCMLTGHKGGTCRNNMCECRERWGRRK